MSVFIVGQFCSLLELNNRRRKYAVNMPRFRIRRERNPEHRVLVMTSPTMTSPLRPHTRKITIKNLKSTPDSVPAAYFQQTTEKLQRAVDTILSEGSLVDSLEELYRGVENLVRENKGPELYEMLRNSCQTFVEEDMRRKVEKGVAGSVGIGGDGGLRAVECIESTWGKWTSQLVSLH
jgi:hypothetical protein